MMKFALYTNSISPHQLPLAKAMMAQIGVANYKYIYTDVLTQERQRMGWGDKVDASWCMQGDESHPALLDADVVMSGLRSLSLFEKRNQMGKRTIYVSERWFKPPLGFLRLLVPSYFKMAKRFVKAFASPQMYLMPQGIHAARDMARLIGWMRGDLRCLFRAPKVAFESRPGGRIVPLKDAIREGVLSQEEIAFGTRYGFVQIPKAHWDKVKPQGIYAKMRLWGYFVEPATTTCERFPIERSSPKVLWVGRMLDWKRTKDLVKACGDKISLSLYGKGPEEENLKKLAKEKSNVAFHDFVPISDVRNLMRMHDIYVLPSDGGEGWGAVVNEALEEGMRVLGTVDAGSTATILPPTHLYKAGDTKRLARLLSQSIIPFAIGEWSVENAAKVFLELNS